MGWGTWDGEAEKNPTAPAASQTRVRLYQSYGGLWVVRTDYPERSVDNSSHVARSIQMIRGMFQRTAPFVKSFDKSLSVI